jgi:1-deoxy-D-xylulose-5-phosphate reductoisomerase
MSARTVAILGSTGSIGRTTLEVISSYPERYRVVALTANRNADALLAQVERFRPELAVLADGSAPAEGPSGTRLATGWDAVLEAAAHRDAEIVVNGLVGAAGLEPSLLALEGGKRLALANKESLVVGGPLVMRALEQGGGELIPVDSEHCAVFQCLEGAAPESVRRVVLTASGGPFRNRDPLDLSGVTPDEALRHPTWDMGAKITIDSATLVNKALEVVEAHFLFGLQYDQVAVVIHPQSNAPSLDLAEVGSLEFEPVPEGRFPAFELGREAALRGGTAPAVFNAASEEAVAAFLQKRLRFTGIPEVIHGVLDAHAVEEVTELEGVRRVDGWARETARARVDEIGNQAPRSE